MQNKTNFDYSPEKNAYLKKTRGVSFEEIEIAINEGGILDVIEVTNTEKHPNQKMYVVNMNNYVYLVPFVRNDNVIFLKTIFPSRKFTKLYLKKS